VFTAPHNWQQHPLSSLRTQVLRGKAAIVFIAFVTMSRSPLEAYEGLPFSPSSSLLFGCTASRCSIYRGLGVDPRALELLAYVM
jgi:hypothetical protein